MKKYTWVLIITFFASSAFSQNDSLDATSSVINQKFKAKKNVDEVDQKITNRRFRASNGSLSKLSMNFSLSYNGGSLDKPFAADRPNISNAGDTTSIAGVSGTVNGTYRLDTLNRLSLGTGVQMLAPFNEDIDTDDQRAQREFTENRRKLDVSNPYLSYTHMNNFFEVQTVATATLTQFTASNLRDIGYQNAVDGSLNTMYAVENSGFSFGVVAIYTKYFFDKNDNEFQASQNDVVFGLLPQIEYIINDTFNLRTIVRSNWYQNTKADSKFDQRPVTQSVGLGISVSRDVFFYPNIQFVPKDLKAANTNIGVTADINMF